MRPPSTLRIACLMHSELRYSAATIRISTATPARKHTSEYGHPMMEELCQPSLSPKLKSYGPEVCPCTLNGYIGDWKDATTTSRASDVHNAQHASRHHRTSHSASQRLPALRPPDRTPHQDLRLRHSKHPETATPALRHNGYAPPQNP